LIHISNTKDALDNTAKLSTFLIGIAGTIQTIAVQMAKDEKESTTIGTWFGVGTIILGAGVTIIEAICAGINSDSRKTVKKLLDFLDYAKRHQLPEWSPIVITPSTEGGSPTVEEESSTLSFAS
jgi:hypothetical protein